jgi:hypothetical protein
MEERLETLNCYVKLICMQSSVWKYIDWGFSGTGCRREYCAKEREVTVI